MTARRGMEHKVQRLIPNHRIVWALYLSGKYIHSDFFIRNKYTRPPLFV